MVAVLVDSGGAESSVGACVLVDDSGTELLVMVFTGCRDTIGGLTCLVMPLVSHVEAALAVDLVGAGSLDAGFSAVQGTGLLATWPSVVLSVHVKAASAIAEVVGAKSLAGVFIGCVDANSGASWVMSLASHVEAALAMKLVDVGSLVALGNGLLAASSSVIFSVDVEASWVIAAASTLFEPSAGSVVILCLSIDLCPVITVLTVSGLEARGGMILPDLVRVIVEDCAEKCHLFGIMDLESGNI